MYRANQVVDVSHVALISGEWRVESGKKGRREGEEGRAGREYMMEDRGVPCEMKG